VWLSRSEVIGVGAITSNANGPWLDPPAGTLVEKPRSGISPVGVERWTLI
jgi:hypothetical protein